MPPSRSQSGSKKKKRPKALDVTCVSSLRGGGVHVEATARGVRSSKAGIARIVKRVNKVSRRDPGELSRIPNRRVTAVVEDDKLYVQIDAGKGVTLTFALLLDPASLAASEQVVEVPTDPA